MYQVDSGVGKASVTQARGAAGDLGWSPGPAVGSPGSVPPARMLRTPGPQHLPRRYPGSLAQGSPWNTGSRDNERSRNVRTEM